IIDMRIRLKLEEKKYDERTCIIITNVNDLLIGFIVDSVEEVAKINESNVSEPPKVTSEYIYTYITGIAKLNNDIILVLDLKKILSEKELELITNLF
ncbi:MAG: chemotaxis protein CheW, partial [Sedimentibacter sp.]